jgi:hypothetical protein
LGFAQTGIPYGLLQLPLSRYQRIWSDVAKGMLAEINKNKKVFVMPS